MLVRDSALVVPGAWAGSGQIGLVLRHNSLETLLLVVGTTSSTCGFTSEKPNLVRVPLKCSLADSCVQLAGPKDSLNPCLDVLKYLDPSQSMVRAEFDSRYTLTEAPKFSSQCPAQVSLAPLTPHTSPFTWIGDWVVKNLYVQERHPKTRGLSKTPRVAIITKEQNSGTIKNDKASDTAESVINIQKLDNEGQSTTEQEKFRVGRKKLSPKPSFNDKLTPTGGHV